MDQQWCSRFQKCWRPKRLDLQFFRSTAQRNLLKFSECRKHHSQILPVDHTSPRKVQTAGGNQDLAAGNRSFVQKTEI